MVTVYAHSRLNKRVEQFRPTQSSAGALVAQEWD